MSTSTRSVKTLASKDQLLSELKKAIADRRVDDGITLLERNRTILNNLHSEPGDAALIGYLAQWVDIGFDRPDLVKTILKRFVPADRATLPLADYAFLRTAEGMVLMTEEASDEAITHFDFVFGLGNDFSDKQSLAIVNFWKARCLRKKGEYDEAMLSTARARDLALEAGSPRMAAVMRVLESWLWFQKARLKEAVRLLRESEEVLEETDDHVTLGNIQSAYGRICSREGQFDRSLEHFARAIEYYKRRDAEHRNLARSLVNTAQAERMIALQLRKKIDADFERRRKAVSRGKASKSETRTDFRQRMEQLRRQAKDRLDEALTIYAHHPNRHGEGSVHLGFGTLSLDRGDYDRAEKEAETAFRLGEDKQDYLLMARARLLGCMIENACVEDEIGEGADPGLHARRAEAFVREAIELASHTQDRRLLATAHLWEGMTQANAFFDNADAARHACDTAAGYLKGDDASDVWDDLRVLRQRILRRGTIDTTLRAWSQGTVGDKTFQQITEEFAELIIPKVWEREGRKVSRVAARLSISPKKVRRILGRTGRLGK